MNSQTPKASAFGTHIETVSSLDEMVLRLLPLFEREMQLSSTFQKDSNTLQNSTYQSLLNIDQKYRAELFELIKKELSTFLVFPPCHIRHKNKLEEFHRSAGFEESIFIMTKFPDGNDEIDSALKRVIDTVVRSITNCGFYPRLASDYSYHPNLWDNVELYLLGCSRGIAILEDRYKPELNPNVAMEWGWMKGMGKDVLYLVESGFKHYRADWSGLIRCTFSWDEPENYIQQAIVQWLKPKMP